MVINTIGPLGIEPRSPAPKGEPGSRPALKGSAASPAGAGATSPVPTAHTTGDTTAPRPFAVPADSLTARILFALSDDPARPTRLKQVVMALPSARLKSVGGELADLVARGAVARVRKGVYVRLVGPVAGGCS